MMHRLASTRSIVDPTLEGTLVGGSDSASESQRRILKDIIYPISGLRSDTLL
jgi:hypothetical protein